jgi:hypothetical protein
MLNVARRKLHISIAGGPLGTGGAPARRNFESEGADAIARVAEENEEELGTS